MTLPSGQPDDSLDRYRQHVRHLGLSREAETALLISVRDMMSNFVDRAFSDDPIQHVQALPEVPKDAATVRDVLNSSATKVPTSNSLADAFTTTVAPGRERRSDE